MERSIIEGIVLEQELLHLEHLSLLLSTSESVPVRLLGDAVISLYYPTWIQAGNKTTDLNPCQIEVP